jgi:DNA polymerase-3 subunit chi
MTEVLFYHLSGQPLERVLPTLLEKTLERGWRAIVQTGSPERRDALNAHLWTYADEAFLPHGTPDDGHAEAQPILLTETAANPNAATVRFVVDRAQPPESFVGYQRIVYIFDGGDPDAIEEARRRWREAKGAGHEVTYWQQDERGRFVRKA